MPGLYRYNVRFYDQDWTERAIYSRHALQADEVCELLLTWLDAHEGVPSESDHDVGRYLHTVLFQVEVTRA